MANVVIDDFLQYNKRFNGQVRVAGVVVKNVARLPERSRQICLWHLVFRL